MSNTSLEDEDGHSKTICYAYRDCSALTQQCFMSCAGQHKTDEELGKVNPNRLLPTICDDGFCLFERFAHN